MDGMDRGAARLLPRVGGRGRGRGSRLPPRSPRRRRRRRSRSSSNGQAQVVPAFNVSAQWVRQRLWVETEFDSDGDGKRDRMHVDVTRPAQTDTEGLKVPVVYETSPYYAGTSGPTAVPLERQRTSSARRRRRASRSRRSRSTRTGPRSRPAK